MHPPRPRVPTPLKALIVLASTLLLPALSAASPAPAKKKIIQGAPIIVDEDGTEPPPPAARVARRSPGTGGQAWVWVGLLALLAVARRFVKMPPNATFAFEPKDYAPGETVRGTLVTEARPESVAAAFELYRNEDDHPVRSVPTTVGEPVRHENVWRTPVSAVLPLDARPDFEGGWAMSVKAVIGKRTALAGDNARLRDF